jgi:hypothetical protein
MSINCNSRRNGKTLGTWILLDVSERHRNLGQMNNKDGMKIESLLQRKNKDLMDSLMNCTSLLRTARSQLHQSKELWGAISQSDDYKL